MENGYTTDSHDTIPKYKRRAVSATRHFPDGCGPARIVVSAVEVPITGALDNSSNPEYVEPVKSSQHEIIDVPKDNHDGDFSVFSAPMERQYPPRRRISAARDFPSLCGKNASCMKDSTAVVASTVKKSVNDEELITCSGNTTGEKMEESVQTTDAKEYQLETTAPCSPEVQVESARQVTNDTRNQDEFGASFENELKMTPQNLLEKGNNSPKESIQHQGDVKSVVALESCKRRVEGLKNSDCLDLTFDCGIVLGLMASGNGSQSHQKQFDQPCNVADSADASSWKNNDSMLQEQTKASVRAKENDVKNFGGVVTKKNKNKNKSKNKKVIKKSSFPSAESHQCMGMLSWDTEENLDDDKESHDFRLVRRPHIVDVTLPPSCPSSLGNRGDGSDSSVTRTKVRDTLRLFQAVFRKIVKENEAKLKHIKRPDLEAATVLKSEGKYVNTNNKIIGSVPGVEVGDEFQYRVELNIIGLHRPTQGGIDYVKEGGRLLATSIVASGGYDDDLDDSDVLIYSGSGGMVKGHKEPEDQKLERGNLALKNSCDARNAVRVIRGDTRAPESSSGRTRTYVYDGLYLVEKYWQEIGPHGKLIFKFKLIRIPGQPELAFKVVNKSKKFKVREGLCVDDISKGGEKIPICSVNTIDDEKPLPFEYITRVIYPDCYSPIPPGGCNCTNGCSEISICYCVAKNGGEIPYNHSGAIVEAKPLVHECGPSCKCPPSCYNRVAQHGIKFQLEIFKTESRGWGLRSINSIPSGSFVCEYIGELLEEKEAEQRASNDEYLFDIGNNSNDLCDGLSNLVLEEEESSFTIDAAKYGNVGRFINHSCSPNLYAQKVLYDHEDKRIPHIMLFAAENIPPLQELTYHYNYAIDHVSDSDGNIRKKNCYCGSSECTGRMY